jgi:predicted transcriptional regulator
MTKKMTITLEDTLIEELTHTATSTGKKRAQIVTEALQDYFDIQAVTKSVIEYKKGTLKTTSHKDLRDSLGL